MTANDQQAFDAFFNLYSDQEAISKGFVVVYEARDKETGRLRFSMIPPVGAFSGQDTAAFDEYEKSLRCTKGSEEWTAYWVPATEFMEEILERFLWRSSKASKGRLRDRLLNFINWLPLHISPDIVDYYIVLRFFLQKCQEEVAKGVNCG